MTRRLVAGVLVACVLGLLAFVGAGPASAHAVRVATDPAQDAALATGPPRVSATFNILYDDPETTPPEAFRLDLCAATDREVAPNDAGVIVKRIPAGRCAVLRHIGPEDGLAAVEAAMAGIPIVAADLAVLREVLSADGGTAATFVAPSDVAGWAAAMDLVQAQVISSAFEQCEAGWAGQRVGEGVGQPGQIAID